MSGRGRPTKLTEERSDSICEALKDALPLDSAARYAGVSVRAVQLWLKRGEDELARINAAFEEDPDAEPEIDPAHEIYVKFALNAREAQSKAEHGLLKQIRTAAMLNWKAAAWLLSKLYPDRYTDKERVELSGPDGNPIEMQSKHDVPPGTLDQIGTLLARTMTSQRREEVLPGGEKK